MFKNLLDFWKGKDFLTNVTEDFGNMLKDAQDMFEMVCKNLFGDKIIDNLEDRIYEVDKKINLFEKDIRKRIISHLSIQPSVDVPMSLLMMSVVKDAERLGDYAKNLYEVPRLLRSALDAKTFGELYGDMDRTIIKMFEDTKRAFIDSDEQAARDIWQTERTVVKRCDRIIEELAKSGLETDQAVAFTLIARYFKRTAAHLTNIATSVILPISELDFFDEKRREQE
jgi:phosphate uptake regulator